MITTYDGALSGLTNDDGAWTFEGRSYDTPADETAVLETTGEALEEPSEALTEAARRLVFGPGGATFTAQALSAIALAYEAETGGGDGCDPVTAILREAARRIAVVEALTV